MSDNDPKSPLHWLDRIDTVASAVYVLLMAIVAGAIIAVLFYLATHWPEGYGIGPQGEGVYLGLGILLVICWVMGQLAWIMRRRRRSSWMFQDGSEIQLPKISSRKGGFSIQWGQAPSDTSNTPPDTHTWTIPVSSDTRTFRVDRFSLDAARAARASGASWDAVCRQINPEWDGMNALDRALYRQALEAAVDAPDADS